MRFLIMDIGAGTLDILLYDTDADIHYKAVLKSPTRRMAEEIRGLKKDILITGKEMGGGEIGSTLKEHVSAGFEVIISDSASKTIHHNPERVSSMGIKVVNDDEAEELKHSNRYQHLYFSDIEYDRIKHLVQILGLDFSFDIIGVCAQDHGVPLEDVSHLEFRQRIFKERLDVDPEPKNLLYTSHDVPDYLNRLKSISEEAGRLPARKVYVMDSGMCAISGAMLDQWVQDKDRYIVIDVATSHTLGASIKDNKIAGFFEYHTSDITPERLESLIYGLAWARISHDALLKEGGHGAYVREAIGYNEGVPIIVTGPRRDILKNSRLPLIFGSPFGDNMMTGTSGLLWAILSKI